MSAISRPVTYVTKVDFAQLDGYGVPDDGLGNLGDRYYDIGAGRWYLKRWVGNFNGTDNVKCPPIIGVNQNEDFTFEALFRPDPAIGNYKFIVHNNTNVTLPGGIGIGTLGSNTLAGIEHYGTNTCNITPVSAGVWHRIAYRGRYASGAWYDELTIDGVIRTQSVANAFAQANVLMIGSTVGRQWLGQICNVQAAGNSTSLKLPFEDGAGAFVKDVSGNGNNGTLTDGAPTTFWYQSWVPMDLL